MPGSDGAPGGLDCADELRIKAAAPTFALSAGCVAPPVEGDICDDGDAGTYDDQIRDGVCAGLPIGDPQDEVCNGLDDDNNGQVDDGDLNVAVPNGVIACVQGAEVLQCNIGFAPSEGGCGINPTVPTRTTADRLATSSTSRTRPGASAVSPTSSPATPAGATVTNSTLTAARRTLMMRPGKLRGGRERRLYSERHRWLCQRSPRDRVLQHRLRGRRSRRSKRVRGEPHDQREPLWRDRKSPASGFPRELVLCGRRVGDHRLRFGVVQRQRLDPRWLRVPSRPVRAERQPGHGDERRNAHPRRWFFEKRECDPVQRRLVQGLNV